MIFRCVPNTGFQRAAGSLEIRRISVLVLVNEFCIV
jgi:hypothetical protein